MRAFDSRAVLATGEGAANGGGRAAPWCFRQRQGGVGEGEGGGAEERRRVWEREGVGFEECENVKKKETLTF